MQLVKALALLGLVKCTACAEDHTPLRFTASGQEIIATGEIDADSLGLFEDIMDDHPNANTLVLRYIGGLVDDAANVEFARVVREMGLTTLVPSDGLVASGGTDLFLAGVDRVVEEEACIAASMHGPQQGSRRPICRGLTPNMIAISATIRTWKPPRVFTGSRCRRHRQTGCIG